MKIATFNVNGVKGRMPRLLEWLGEAKPDIACLQETKTADPTFPAAPIEAAGYGVVFHGQRAHHGVAVLARGEKPVEIRRGLPGDDADGQARWLEAQAKDVHVVSVHLPNGNPVPSPDFDYKLAWLERLVAHAATLVESPRPVVLAGDFNVVPTKADIYNEWPWRFDAASAPERAHLHTFWVNADACRRNAGFRMDFL